MAKDIIQIIREGQELIAKNESMDMTVKEADYIYQAGDHGKDIMSIINVAFLLGVGIGHRIRS